MRTFESSQQEIQGVAEWIKSIIEAGVEPAEIGVFVRSKDQLVRARAAVKAADHAQLELSERHEASLGRIAIGTMPLAKGLEYRAIAVIACDDNILPLQERMEAVADEAELEEAYETERQLFYVACTRARERLLLSGVDPASDFFSDLFARCLQ